ncbi:MAG: transcriptional repressor LexA [bacterium]|nr:transcriptional repressor LexA [bacterium]
MTPITPKQKRFLDFVIEHTEREGYAPSQQEIANALGYKSLGTVQNYLTRLEREGLVEKSWNARRGIRVRLPEGYGYQLPLAGIVSAGKPIEAIETRDTIAVPPTMAREGNFVLRVEGQSMIEDGILDGDYVVVRKQEYAERGQTVVAIMGNEATVKRFHRKGGRIELHPANSAMEPIIVQDDETFRIEGVVVGVIRHLK